MTKEKVEDYLRKKTDNYFVKAKYLGEFKGAEYYQPLCELPNLWAGGPIYAEVKGEEVKLKDDRDSSITEHFLPDSLWARRRRSARENKGREPQAGSVNKLFVAFKDE